MSGRPRTPIGAHGNIQVKRLAQRRYVARTRVRDLDGQLRDVSATGTSTSTARNELQVRLKYRTGYGSGGLLDLASPFSVLADLWLAELEVRQISEGTKDNYRDDLRVHVAPYFENYTLGEITTGRCEAFLKSEYAVSYSRAKHSRTLLNQLFRFALRNDVISRNPVEGTSPLTKPKGAPQALTLEQIARIRHAAATWRMEPGRPGPRPDGQVRDALEVLLGTSVRPGEVLALRPVDIEDGRRGMVAHVRGTVVYRKATGTSRQPHPKTDASIRSIAVPEFAADVIRVRLKDMTPDQAEWTVFHNRKGGPLSQHNFRRTFRQILELAGLQESGITPRWYRRTGATVLARGLGVDVAADHLGHASTAITEGHYIEPDQAIDYAPAGVLERTLRPVNPEGALLSLPVDEEEELALDELDAALSDDDSVA